MSVIVIVIVIMIGRGGGGGKGKGELSIVPVIVGAKGKLRRPMLLGSRTAAVRLRCFWPLTSPLLLLL